MVSSGTDASISELRKSGRELVIGSTVGRILGRFTEFIRYLTDVLCYFALLRLSRSILALEVWGPPKELGEYPPAPQRGSRTGAGRVSARNKPYRNNLRNQLFENRLGSSFGSIFSFRPPPNLDVNLVSKYQVAGMKGI